MQQIEKRFQTSGRDPRAVSMQREIAVAQMDQIHIDIRAALFADFL
jgi:hypothetical protein